MPAINMGAASGAATAAGAAVIMSPYSGPTGSPFTATEQAGNFSTGALNTGIGFGLTPIFGQGRLFNTGGLTGFSDLEFTDDYTPGVTLPDGTASTTSILTAIGGGKSTANVGGIAPTVPYVALPLLGFGGGNVARDGTASGTGKAMKTVTSAAGTAINAQIETGFTNQTGRALVAGESAFGSASADSPVVA